MESTNRRYCYIINIYIGIVFPGVIYQVINKYQILTLVSQNKDPEIVLGLKIKRGILRVKTKAKDMLCEGFKVRIY